MAGLEAIIGVKQTLSSRPPLDDSATGLAVLSGELVYRGPADPVLGHVMPGTPVNEVESILVAPLRVGERVQGTLNVPARAATRPGAH